MRVCCVCSAYHVLCIAAFTTLAFIMLHVSWGVIFMGSLDSELVWRKASGVAGVTATHLLVSGLVSNLGFIEDCFLCILLWVDDRIDNLWNEFAVRYAGQILNLVIQVFG